MEMTPDLRRLERELEGDLKYLRRKAVRLIDNLVITQGKIAKVKWRLRKLQGSSYCLPDGRTK